MSPTHKATDHEYQDGTITEVVAGKRGWSITWREDGDDLGGLGFWVPDKGIVPVVGSRARFYGQGFGSVVRGLDVDGRQVFYRTPAQQAALETRQHAARDRQRRRDFERDRARMDAEYQALPPEFQRRLDGFRSRRPDWRVQFEGYEMSACRDAVRIAAYLAGQSDKHAAIKTFHDLDWEQQLETVPGLFEGHSGNSFGQACRLALVYATEPQHIERMHGALCPLVGCDDYGCWAASDEAKAQKETAAV